MTRVKGLGVAPTLILPLDAVTQTFGLLGVRRSGKSNTAAVMAEEMSDAVLPWVAIDPKGDWWGLRSSADGKGAGLPVPIFGGLHGDMPLTPESGRLMAELIVEHNLTCVLDVSRFSKTQRAHFLTDFALRLYELHQADPQPRHVFLEEADRLIPQRVTSDMAPCVGAWSDLVRLGGAFGLGVTLISQRSAVVNKDVLTQVETMIAMRTTSPQDRKAIHDWMEHHAIAAEIVDSLPSLASGEAWVSSSYWLTGHGQEAIQRVRFRQRKTFDSGATPAIGRQRRVATLADIDLGALEGRMTAVIEKAARDDPARLRRRITELERQIAKARPGDAGEVARLTAENRDLAVQLSEARARPAERVEVPVFGPGDIAALEQHITGARDVAGTLELVLSRATTLAAQPPAPAVPRLAPPPAAAEPAGPPAARADGDGDGKLGKAERRVLAVLVQFPEGRTRQQLAVLSGYSPTSLRNPLGRLRTLGLAGKGDPIMITDAGRDAIGDDYEPLPAGPALVSHWMSVLGKAERTVLAIFLDAWPGPVSRPELAERSGYSETSLRNPLGRLRTLELVHDWTADETLAAAARETTGA